MCGAHVRVVSESMHRKSGEQPTTRLQKEKLLETTVGTKAMQKDRPKDKVECEPKDKVDHEGDLCKRDIVVELQVEAG